MTLLFQPTSQSLPHPQLTAQASSCSSVRTPTDENKSFDSAFQLSQDSSSQQLQATASSSMSSSATAAVKNSSHFQHLPHHHQLQQEESMKSNGSNSQHQQHQVSTILTITSLYYMASQFCVLRFSVLLRFSTLSSCRRQKLLNCLIPFSGLRFVVTDALFE